MHPHPAVSCMSCLVMERTALAIIRLAVSPTPIGRTPGHTPGVLSRAISLQGEIDLGSI